MPSTLDGNRELSLMPGASARLAPGPNLAAITHIAPQEIWLLVIDIQILISTKSAGLDPASKAPARATTPTPTVSSTGTAGPRRVSSILVL